MSKHAALCTKRDTNVSLSDAVFETIVSDIPEFNQYAQSGNSNQINKCYFARHVDVLITLAANSHSFLIKFSNARSSLLRIIPFTSPDLARSQETENQGISV